MRNNYFLMLLASVLLLFSCRTELDSSKKHEDNLQRSSNKISLSQFKNETRVKNFKTSIKASISLKNKAGKSETLLSVFQVDTENINKLDFKENTTYSFRAYNIFESPDQVYNVIYYRKNNQWQYSILKLIKGTDTSFDIIPVYDSRYGSISPVENAHTGRTCLVSYDTTEYHCTCPPSWAECDQCSQCISTHSGTIAYDCGNGSGTGTSDGNSGGNTDPGGGGGNPVGYDPSGYTFDPSVPPAYDAAYIRAKRADAFFKQLDFYGAQVWPSQNPEIYCAILEYYLDQLPPFSVPQDQNALTIANWAIKFLVQNPDTLEPENLIQRAKALDDALAQNPNLLLNIPCDQLPAWQELATHIIPQSVKNKIFQVNGNTGWFSSAIVQNLDYSNSFTINMDVYPVKISNMPEKSPGIKYTYAEFFDYFRKNINNFTDEEHGKFYPVVDPQYGINDTQLWNSNNPIGSLITIKIPADNGTVVCSGFGSQAWIFTTVKSPWDGEHPVSGNRLFGYSVDASGNMIIYTRGVDRFTTKVSNNALQYTVESFGYSKAKEMWKTMQQKVSSFVNSKNGSSSIIQGIDYTPNYIFVKDYLKGNKPITALGCH